MSHNLISFDSHFTSTYSKTRLNFISNSLKISTSSSLFYNCVRKCPRLLLSCSKSSLLRPWALTTDEAVENSNPKEMMPKLDKSGRFCSPRAARELALMILYAACLEGSDPVRLFEKRLNARRESGYEFDRSSLMEYNHMSFGGPPDEPAGRILELSILHLAMSEIAVLGTRHQIVINEAVDLAKRFCDGAAPRVINGCLRTFMKDAKGNVNARESKIEQTTIQTTDLSFFHRKSIKVF
ncbi:unnamed protein product [Fraxinus pennsylvanica]|uniref:NusB/RsmB/TIM44 domain-containing protein n=1 Tax=Fraxinus pennsylvanica TaxID=56036 RepID=A0AAD2DV66_9LAMI|nr:unnamed protein product [Fraxinus pennsylvanica]